MKTRQISVEPCQTEPHQTIPLLVEPLLTEPRLTEPCQREPRQTDHNEKEPRRQELQSVTSNKLYREDFNQNEVEVENSSSSEKRTNVEEVFQKQSQMKLHRQGSKRSIRNTIMNGFGRLMSDLKLKYQKLRKGCY